MLKTISDMITGTFPIAYRNICKCHKQRVRTIHSPQQAVANTKHVKRRFPIWKIQFSICIQDIQCSTEKNISEQHACPKVIQQ